MGDLLSDLWRLTTEYKNKKQAKTTLKIAKKIKSLINNPHANEQSPSTQSSNQKTGYIGKKQNK